MRSGFWRRQWLKREKRAAQSQGRFPWNIAALVLLIIFIIPVGVDFVAGREDPFYLRCLEVTVIVIYTFASIMLIWEALAALRGPKICDTDLPLPSCTAIIAAYLPNEQEIIIQTVLHMLEQVNVPPTQFQVVLAYNTPEPLPVEDTLRTIAAHDKRLTLLRVDDSHSKAQNVNAALGAATGLIIGVYDADHLPEPDCFRKAWRSLARGYDVVQGRCIIRNYNENWVTRTIAIEFDMIYAVSHQGRSNVSGTGIFGGSNGYWRADALRDAGMNAAMLTEDIDSSVRTLLSGRKIIHDRSIQSFELAPTRPLHWYFQRKRWSQGWLEVTLKYQRALLATSHFTVFQKFIWLYLLGWREIYAILSMQIFPLLLAAWLLHYPLHWFKPGLYLAFSIFNLGSNLVVLGITAICASQEGRRGLGAWYWAYALFTLAYTTVKTIISLMAQYAHFARDTTWVTTPRMAPVATKRQIQDIIDEPNNHPDAIRYSAQKTSVEPSNAHDANGRKE